jgi:hypothetical protein
MFESKLAMRPQAPYLTAGGDGESLSNAAPGLDETQIRAERDRAYASSRMTTGAWFERKREGVRISNEAPAGGANDDAAKPGHPATADSGFGSLIRT